MILLEAGDFSGDGNEAGKLKTKTYVEALQGMGCEVSGIGDRELSGTLDLFDEMFGKLRYPLISGTYTERGGDQTFRPASVIKEYELPGKRKFKVGYLSLSAYNSLLARTGGNGRAIVSRDPADQARRFLPDLASKADMVVLLANLSPKDVARVADAAPGAVKLALGGFGDRISPGGLEDLAGIPTLYAGDQGKRLGEVRVFLDGTKVKEMTANLVFLTRRYPEDAKYKHEIDTTVARVNQILKESAAMASPVPSPSNGMPGSLPGAVPAVPATGPSASKRYLTSAACAECHETEHRVWEGSAHARAMETLVKANQDYNPECVRCHTTGAGAPEGFVTARATPNLINVQCEACHGSAALHVLDATKPYGRVAPRVCYTCHTKENSPEFSFFKYWDQIKH